MRGKALDAAHRVSANLGIIRGDEFHGGKITIDLNDFNAPDFER